MSDVPGAAAGVPVIPWMTDSEIALLASRVRPTDYVHEWGSGGSTVWFSRHARDVFSVEHNREWHDRVRDATARMRNVGVIHVPADDGWDEQTDDDGDERHFQRYAMAQSGQVRDVVLIDGRARVLCARSILFWSTMPRVVFVHDYGRPEYAPMWDVLRRFDTVEKLAACTVIR